MASCTSQRGKIDLWLPFEMYSNEVSLAFPTSAHTRHLQTRMPNLLTALYQKLPPCLQGPDGLRSSKYLEIPESEARSLLPLRLLDVGDTRLPLHQVRLKVRFVNEKGHYAALSHRWGGKVPLRTTRRTLKRHLLNLPIESLPATFRDAITVTRLLGIRYLWIDALCIIQDVRQDWEAQASEMGSIFQSAVATIAVHSARNSAEGFLHKRNIPNALCITHRGLNGDMESGVWVKIPPLSDYAVARAVMKSEITSRAWVAQEMSLSRRILHFVEDSLSWECYCSREDCSSEHSGIKLGYALRGTALRPSKSWLDFVEGYSSWKMTKTSDKLPAISGIASSWSERSNINQEYAYYCGIFDDDVHRSLLWSRKCDPLIIRPDRAPTWSWASVDGEINFTQRFPSLTPVMERMAIKCACGRDSKWHVTCAKCAIQLKALIGSGLDLGYPEKSKRFSFTPHNGPRRLITLLQRSAQQHTPVGWAIFDHNGPDDVSSFRYVQIFNNSKDGEWWGSFTVVVKPSRTSNGLYSRVGMGYIFRAEVFAALQQEVITIA